MCTPFCVVVISAGVLGVGEVPKCGAATERNRQARRVFRSPGRRLAGLWSSWLMFLEGVCVSPSGPRIPVGGEPLFPFLGHTCPSCRGQTQARGLASLPLSSSAGRAPRHLGAHPSFPGKGVNPVGVSVNIFSSSRCLAAPKSSKKGLFPITSRWLSFPL